MPVQSPFSQLYLSIVERIKTEVPEIKYIDQDLGQMENYDMRPAVAFPCALVDIDEFDFTDIGCNRTQNADGFVIIRLANPQWSSSSGNTTTAVREMGLSYYEVEHKLIQKLHGYAPEGFNRLMRRKVRTEKRDDLYRVRIIAFSLNYTDKTTEVKRLSANRPEPTFFNG